MQKTARDHTLKKEKGFLHWGQQSQKKRVSAAGSIMRHFSLAALILDRFILGTAMLL
ncbi:MULTISPECIES: hypothetical protein [unclassified Paracoccus (in: a-proteobacteria)]|uniref:hypothetical protein n=1 Tax=unclassified Paracoccus (in: a-proteobacteria) TaxID=2688777 RepID=UPI001603E853|nr:MULTISPECIES: hypothetical protein [unclassified Paracoccus (in: a-proteobacteria)]MBB1493185.1 hypothetical protein [Paracoccus sp. MC1854]MBB1499449.1 hypothetical protein [Paracoccus sp. MC1862]QQO45118.1 hypothetical protein JGR78_01560 [Paracoccus sp. MC1862]